MFKRIKKGLTKVKGWIISFLVFLGLVTVPLMAQNINFTYVPATQYETGEPMPLSDIEYTRLYCDGVMVAEEPGADADIAANLPVGTHTCYGTHVANGLESVPSNSVQRVVEFGPPKPPVLD